MCSGRMRVLPLRCFLPTFFFPRAMTSSPWYWIRSHVVFGIADPNRIFAVLNPCTDSLRCQNDNWLYNIGMTSDERFLVVPLHSRGKHPDRPTSALVSESDYERAAKYSWHLSCSGQKSKGELKLYVRAWVGGVHVLLHRFVLNVPHNSVSVDHINRNPIDCRRSNLRISGQSQNIHNQPCRNPTGFKGVFDLRRYYPNQENPFMASIGWQSRVIRLGRFPTPEGAAHAYDEAARKYFGDQCRVNFPIGAELSAR